VPLDGIWLDDHWYFGGSAAAVKHSNLKADPRAVLHLEDAGSAVIVEGSCEELLPDGALGARLGPASGACSRHTRSPGCGSRATQRDSSSTPDEAS
jgi:hypothetical protein